MTQFSNIFCTQIYSHFLLFQQATFCQVRSAQCTAALFSLEAASVQVTTAERWEGSLNQATTHKAASAAAPQVLVGCGPSLCCAHILIEGQQKSKIIIRMLHINNTHNKNLRVSLSKLSLKSIRPRWCEIGRKLLSPSLRSSAHHVII